MSRKNRRSNYQQNKPRLVTQSQSLDNEQIFIQRGNLALVGEARPRKTPAPPSASNNLRSKVQSLSLDWDDNEALQIQAQRPLTEAERKETLYSVYVGNTWVSSCVDVISKRFTSGGWHLEEVEEGKGQEANKDKLKQFLLDINDDEDFLQFLRGVADDLDIYGESYTETLVKSNRTVKFKPEQIIRWWFPSKRARKVAFSPIEKMVNPTYADKSMVDWVHMFFKKGTRPSTWIKLGDDSDIDDARQYLKFYKENYTGAQNAHTPQIAYGGAEINEYGKGSIDVDFGKGRLFTREEVLAGYGVPPACIGIIESGNIGSGTGEDQDKALRNNTVDPLKQLILEKLNRRIVVGAFGITDWIVTTKYADYRSDVEISEVQSKRIFSGISTPNQERIDSGKAPYPETGDTPVIVAGREIIPLDRLDDLSDKQRQAAQVQIDTSKAALDMAQTQADKAKHPDPVSPALNGQQQNTQDGKPAPVPGASIPKETPQEESKSVEPDTSQEQPKESVSFTKQQQFGIGAWQQADPITQQRLADMRERRVKALKWKPGKNACYACTMNSSVIVSLGESFPSGALIAPCHDGCECEVEEIFLEEGSQHSFFVKASDNGGNQSQNNSNANKN